MAQTSLPQTSAGMLVSHQFGSITLPVPVPSQLMSGSLSLIRFRVTVLSDGCVPAGSSTVTTTPPDANVAPPGTLPVIQLCFTVTSCAPTIAMPMPESGGPSPGGHTSVLSLTLFQRTSMSPAGPGASARNSMPTQFSVALLA